jgi:hypothetical protein
MSLCYYGRHFVFLYLINDNIMKTLIRIFAFCFVVTAFTALVPAKANGQGPVSFQVFYDDLSPYGRWADYPGYGYVWMPDAGADFMPYSTAGYWAMTDYGWTWVSDYSWGWAPFHYGRWDFNQSYGWFWIPDETWGPAWVSWRRAPGYYGWAPLGPGMSLEMATRGGYEMREDRWMFMDERHFGDRDMKRYYGPRERRAELMRSSTAINNTYEDKNRHSTYISGPRREEVQKLTRTSIRPVAVHENEAPGQSLKNNELNIYRPRIERTASNGANAAPRNVKRMDENNRRPVPPSPQNQAPAQRQDMPNDRIAPDNRQGRPQPDTRPQPNNAPRQEQPRQEQPRPGQQAPEQGRQQPPRMEQPRQEQRMEQPRQDQPRMEQPRPQQPRMEQPRPEAPRHEAPRQVQPRMEQPHREAPRPEQPRMEQPRPEPRMEAPREAAPRPNQERR